MFWTAVTAAVLREVVAVQVTRELPSLTLSQQWPGLSAPLDEIGYERIVATRDHGQIWRFIRRVVAAHGGTIQAEVPLQNLVQKTIETKPIRSLDALVQELSGATWVNGFSPEFFQPTKEFLTASPSVNLFIAGLEGAGHHFAKSLMDSCVNKSNCVIDPELTSTLWESRDHKDALEGAWKAAAVRYSEEANASTKLRVLNAYDLSDKVGEIAYTGMMTYPSFSSEWVPRLDLYSAVAQESGDKLFALVLVRDPHNMICSEASPSKPISDYEAMALTALVEQLRTLAPDQYRCMDYDMLPYMTPNVLRFLEALTGPTFAQSASSLIERLDFDKPMCNGTDEGTPDAARSFAMLQQQLFQLCRIADASPDLVPRSQMFPVSSHSVASPSPAEPAPVVNSITMVAAPVVSLSHPSHTGNHSAVASPLPIQAAPVRVAWRPS